MSGFSRFPANEEPVFISLFRQNPVLTSLHLRSPVHVVLPQDNNSSVILSSYLETLGMDSEFLLGDDILVAPVLEEGLTARHAAQPITRDDTVAEFIDS
jgi:hypothetical protein